MTGPDPKKRARFMRGLERGMKHSNELAHELLVEYHTRTPVEGGARVQYPPKTAEASLFWKHTGVCPGCSFRTISCGRCPECGWRAEPVTSPS